MKLGLGDMHGRTLMLYSSETGLTFGAQPDSSFSPVSSTGDLACVHSFVCPSEPLQSQRHTSCLHLLKVQTHSALIAPPLCHMTIFIQVDTVCLPKPPNLHSNRTGCGRQMTGKCDIIITWHSTNRGDQFKICRGKESFLPKYTHMYSTLLN